MLGWAVFALVGDPAEGVDNAPTPRWISAFVVLGAVCVGLMLFSRSDAAGTKAPVFGTTTGVRYSVSATLMKPVMETLNASGVGEVLDGWQFCVMAVTGLFGFYRARSHASPRALPGAG